MGVKKQAQDGEILTPGTAEWVKSFAVDGTPLSAQTGYGRTPGQAPGGGGGGGWDLTSPSLVTSVSVDDEANVSDMFFKPDGTKLYTVGFSNDTVFEYHLSTAWDLSTLSAAPDASKDVSAQANATGVYFKSDGTKMYVNDYSGNTVYEYDLSTAWLVSSASYNSVSTSNNAVNGYGIAFSDDGTKMYVADDSAKDIGEHDLSTAWDLSSASLSQSQSIPGSTPAVRGIWFKPDGTRMYRADPNDDKVYEYTLSTAWDVSTLASGDDYSITDDAVPQGITFKDSDGTRMYVWGGQFDKLYEYNVS